MRRALIADAGLVVLLAGASVLVGPVNPLNERPALGPKSPYAGDPSAWHRDLAAWWVLSLLCVAGLLIRRHRPFAALTLATAGTAGHLLLLPALGVSPLDLAVPVTLYTLASLTPDPWRSRVATGVLALAAYAINLGYPDSRNMSVSGSTALALILVLAAALGEGARLRRASLDAAEQRAAALEREHGQREALAIAAERARITRELHDVIAHGLSVMVIQTQGAAAALRHHPDRAETALAEVVTTGRGALAEIRRLLGVLRREPGTAPDRAPQPGVAAIPALVDQVRATGTEVDLHIDGAPVSLPASVDLSAYRIVQEALTNVLKHAGTGARATVRLAFTDGGLDIDVSDDGHGTAAPGAGGSPGHGLRGLAERTDMLGGQLTVGHRAGGGFRVRALLPIQPAPAGAAG